MISEAGSIVQRHSSLLDSAFITEFKENLILIISKYELSNVRYSDGACAERPLSMPDLEPFVSQGGLSYPQFFLRFVDNSLIDSGHSG
jgi:hypothetical protein